MYRRTPLANRLYLRGTTWWVWLYDHAGKRQRVSTGQTERKTALEVARRLEVEAQVPTDRAAQAQQALTLGDALELLRAHDVRVRAAPKTREFHENRSRHLVRLLGEHAAVAELSLADTNRYTDQRLAELGGETPQRHTIQKEIRVLLQALTLAKEAGLYAGEPHALKPAAFKKARLFYAPGTTWLTTVVQCQALIDATSSGKVNIDRKLHVVAYLQLGVRRDELQLIKREHVNLAARTVQVDGTKTDGSKRIVALNDTMLAVFERLLRSTPAGQPLFAPWGKANRDLQANWQRAREQLLARGVDASTLPERLSFNDLRRTFCSQMAAAGVPLHHCADLLGHKSLDMVMQVYRRVAPASLQSAVATLPVLQLPELPLTEARRPHMLSSQ